MIQIGFYLLPLIMAGAIVYLLSFTEEKQILGKRFVMIFFAWLVYLFAIERTGFLGNFGFPPRMPLLVVIPAVFMGVFLSGRELFKKVIHQIPTHLIVYLQSFRVIVELLIYGAFLEGILPQQVTFEGTNYDILVGISAIPIGMLIQKEVLSDKGILIWNFISLGILSVTAGSFIYTFYTFDLTPDNLKFVTFPYLLLAGTLLPIAVLLHVISIRQVRSRLSPKLVH